MNTMITRGARFALGSLLLSFLSACTGGGGSDVSPLQAPTIAPIGAQTAEEGEPLSFTVNASNEGPAPVLSITDLPPGASFDSTTGAFSWIPADGDAERGPFNVTFTATDPIETGLSGSETVAITVLPFGSGTFTAIPPVITPNGGAFLDSVTITMTTESDGATIFYTLDGSDPTESSNQYVDPFPLTESATVNARAFRGDLNNSNLSRAIFTVTPNELPVLNPIGNQSVEEQETLSFTVTATDVESTPVLSVTDLPPGATFDPATGEFSWTPAPGAGANSPYSVTFTAADGDNPFLIDTETISIMVNNEPPVLNAIGDQNVDELQTLSFTVTATDAESTPVLSTSALPPGALFSTATGVFNWTPTAGSASGSPYSVTFTATDEIDPNLTVSETIEITVNNDPPVLNPIGNQTVEELQILTFTVTASDAESTPVLSATGLPTDATFDTGSGVFTWAPTVGDATNSPYSVTFTATDAVDPASSVEETIEITVTPFVILTVATPTISPNGGTFDDTVTVTLATTTAGASIRYTIDGSDPTSTSTLYTAPFALTTNGAVVSARAFQAALSDSERATSAPFTINTTISCTVAITSPVVGVLQTSTNLGIVASFSCTPAIPASWGVELAAVGDNSASDDCIERFAPYTCTFGLPRDEYTVTATVVDDMDNVVVGSGAAQDQITSVGIGDYYVAIGDSITSGRGDDISSDNTSSDGRNTSIGYPPILNDELTDSLDYPHTVINTGVEGDTAAAGLLALSGVLSDHPDSQFILVMYGMNDAGPPLPVPSGLGLNAGDAGYDGSFKDTMQQIVTAINNAGKEAIVARINIALGDSATGPQYPDPPNGARSLQIQEYNQVIVSELSNRTLGPDFFTFYRDNPGQYSDNIHPDGAGYQSMAALWADLFD